MGVFVQPPFWAQPYRTGTAPHAVSVLVTAATPEPLSLANAKLYARRNTDTTLDAILPGMLTAARQAVQRDTGIVLFTETYDIFYDALPRDRTPIALPWRPIQSITSFKSIDSAGVEHILDVANYTLDQGSASPFPARVALSTSGAWPTDLRPFQPYVIRIVAGWDNVAKIPAGLIDAVGFRFDAAVNSGPLELYNETIAPFQIPAVA